MGYLLGVVPTHIYDQDLFFLPATQHHARTQARLRWSLSLQPVVMHPVLKSRRTQKGSSGDMCPVLLRLLSVNMQSWCLNNPHSLLEFSEQLSKAATRGQPSVRRFAGRKTPEGQCLHQVVREYLPYFPWVLRRICRQIPTRSIPWSPQLWKPPERGRLARMPRRYRKPWPSLFPVTLGQTQLK